MFTTESQLQELVHNNPDIILTGIPEINPELCPDTPSMLSLGREIPLSSGAIDNMFVDVNAILTFVECKLYSNQEIRREVYSQAINYASNLQSQLLHFEGDEFLSELSKILGAGYQSSYKSDEILTQIVEHLSKDQILEGRNKEEWQKQFFRRLEQNIKSGICRIVILCGSSKKRNFSCQAIRNLMQIMMFSEGSVPKYDLMLMDLRLRESSIESNTQANNDYITKIIWRKYTQLPQIPLIAEYTRNTTAAIERIQALEEQLPQIEKDALDRFKADLLKEGMRCQENTAGYALQWADDRKSTYININIRAKDWVILRHQIRSTENDENLFKKIANGEDISALSSLNCCQTEKPSSLGDGCMYHVTIRPEYPFDSKSYIDAIKALAVRIN
jgi:hypothetical protein